MGNMGMVTISRSLTKEFDVHLSTRIWHKDTQRFRPVTQNGTSGTGCYSCLFSCALSEWTTLASVKQVSYEIQRHLGPGRSVTIPSNSAALVKSKSSQVEVVIKKLFQGRFIRSLRWKKSMTTYKQHLSSRPQVIPFVLMSSSWSHFRDPPRMFPMAGKSKPFRFFAEKIIYFAMRKLYAMFDYG